MLLTAFGREQSGAKTGRATHTNVGEEQTLAHFGQTRYRMAPTRNAPMSTATRVNRKLSVRSPSCRSYFIHVPLPVLDAVERNVTRAKNEADQPPNSLIRGTGRIGKRNGLPA